MTEEPPPPVKAVETSNRLLLVGICLCLLMQLHLVFTQEANWDEFFFLSRIGDFARGTLTRALQSFHVHGFGWLALVPGGELAQITAARLVMLGLETGTTALIYGTARRFIARQGALAAALVYVSFVFVMQHGASFRADPIAAFLMMLACFILAWSRLRLAGLAALAAIGAVAMLVTVKSAFYAPILLALAVWRWWRAGWTPGLAVRLGASAVAAAGIFAGLYFWHQSQMSRADLGGSQTLLTAAYERTIQFSNLFPRADSLLRAALASPVQALLLLAGVGLAVAGLRRGEQDRAVKLVILASAAPLLCFAFYANAYPYFFAFILPPAAIAAGYAAQVLGQRRTMLAGIAMVALAGLTYGIQLQRPRDAQAQHIAAVHEIFPDPVPYIDRCSMIASFPKEGFFMSSWGVESYRDAGIGVFAAILADRAPPLLIANGQPLQAAMRGGGEDGPGFLLPEDAAILRANYIHHWGAIWVAGKTIAPSPFGTAFEILIAGRYTIEGSDDVTLDGTRYRSGDIVQLERGPHVAQSDGSATLRWGDHLPAPSAPPSPLPIFWGF